MMSEKRDSRLNELEIEKRELDIQKAKKEIEKIDIEKAKIELENIELKKGFLKRPQWWAFFTTFVVSAGTFFTLLFNGTFNSLKAKTEADFSILKKEKKEFEIEKDKAKKEFEIEKKKMDSLIQLKTDSLNAYTLDLTELKGENKFLVKEKISLVKSNNLLSNDIKELKDSVIEKEKNATEIRDSITKLNTTFKNYKMNSEYEKNNNRTGASLIQKDLNYAKNNKRMLQMEYDKLTTELEKYKEELRLCKAKLQ
jgi:hypothetical protein